MTTSLQVVVVYTRLSSLSLFFVRSLILSLHSFYIYFLSSFLAFITSVFPFSPLHPLLTSFLFSLSLTLSLILSFNSLLLSFFFLFFLRMASYHMIFFDSLFLFYFLFSLKSFLLYIAYTYVCNKAPFQPMYHQYYKLMICLHWPVYNQLDIGMYT